MHVSACVLVAVAMAISGPQAAARQPDSWASYRFLIGEWAGEGQGQPGSTSGTATFKTDLDGRVLVRTSRTAVPSTERQAAYVHEDLMIVYRDAPGQPPKAVYFDNEDHTIAYDVAVSPDGKTVTFLGRATPSAPRFRLVYTQAGVDTVDVRFEMAPPGSPEAFKVYTQGLMKRK
jgi:hypothetical protein